VRVCAVDAPNVIHRISLVSRTATSSYSWLNALHLSAVRCMKLDSICTSVVVLNTAVAVLVSIKCRSKSSTFSRCRRAAKAAAAVTNSG
jgi:hypothetical protein